MNNKEIKKIMRENKKIRNLINKREKQKFSRDDIKRELSLTYSENKINEVLRE